MFLRNLRRLLHPALFLFALMPFTTSAVVTFFEPVEVNISSREVVTLTGNRWHRKDYSSVGIIATVGEYLPGDTWKWVFMQDPYLVAEQEITYFGGEDACWSDGFCGFRIQMLIALRFPCMPEKEHSMQLFSNGQLVDRKAFKPTRFTPKISSAGVIYKKNIKPKATTFGTTETTNIDFFVADDLGCLENLEDVKVKLTATIEPGSNGHRHFSAEEIGSGKFINQGFSSTLSNNNTVIEGISAVGGIYFTAYEANVLGAIENIKIELERPEDGEDLEEIGVPEDITLNIKIPNLVQIVTDDAIFRDGGGCPHAPLPHWMTSNSQQGVNNVARDYLVGTDSQISINDASLPLGGVIDNRNGGGRNSVCHVSHRRGVDIDINSDDSSGQAMAESMFNDNGIQRNRLQYLDDLFVLEDAYRVIENGSIHFRFPN